MRIQYIDAGKTFLMLGFGGNKQAFHNDARSGLNLNSYVEIICLGMTMGRENRRCAPGAVPPMDKGPGWKRL
jgi:hypothetical protein